MPTSNPLPLLKDTKTTSDLHELDELARHIKLVLPDQRNLTRMHQNHEARFLEITWHARHFVVTLTMDVFELKGRTLLITGASQLMQAALRTKDRNAKTVQAIIESLQAAEDNMRLRPEKAFALLKQVKDTLARLAGKPTLARGY